jgi:iron-sulfur cluster assembly protein
LFGDVTPGDAQSGRSDGLILDDGLSEAADERLDMKIELTENAAKQILKQLAQRGRGIGLRVGVKDVGCSGFGYTYDYADEVKAGDHLIEAHDAKLVVDAKSLEFLDGSTLDYVKEGLKQVFKFTNPNVDATCGCGESFSVKEKA